MRYPYHHFPSDPRADVEHGHALLWAMLRPFTWLMSERVKDWHERLLEPVVMQGDTPYDNPYECTNSACDCGGARERGDLPPVINIVNVPDPKMIARAMEGIDFTTLNPDGTVTEVFIPTLMNRADMSLARLELLNARVSFTGEQVTWQLQAVFGAFGQVEAIEVGDDGVPHVIYMDGSELAFHPIGVERD